VTFFCVAKRKSPKKQRPRFADVSCAPQPKRALRNSHDPLRGRVLKQCSLHVPHFGFLTWRLTGESVQQRSVQTGNYERSIIINTVLFAAPKVKMCTKRASTASDLADRRRDRKKQSKRMAINTNSNFYATSESCLPEICLLSHSSYC